MHTSTAPHNKCEHGKLFLHMSPVNLEADHMQHYPKNTNANASTACPNIQYKPPASPTSMSIATPTRLELSSIQLWATRFQAAMIKWTSCNDQMDKSSSTKAAIAYMKTGHSERPHRRDPACSDDRATCHNCSLPVTTLPSSHTLSTPQHHPSTTPWLVPVVQLQQHRHKRSCCSCCCTHNRQTNDCMLQSCTCYSASLPHNSVPSAKPWQGPGSCTQLYTLLPTLSRTMKHAAQAPLPRRRQLAQK